MHKHIHIHINVPGISARAILSATAIGAVGSFQKCTVSYNDRSTYINIPSFPACVRDRNSPMYKHQIGL
jgi:hypothetical protein